jgi:hypothetical protein
MTGNPKQVTALLLSAGPISFYGLVFWVLSLVVLRRRIVLQNRKL